MKYVVSVELGEFFVPCASRTKSILTATHSEEFKCRMTRDDVKQDHTEASESAEIAKLTAAVGELRQKMSS